MKAIIFNASSGFGNRILPIVSIYAWCKQHGVQMGVIWNRRTHRSGIPPAALEKSLALKGYFKEIPALIKEFSTLEQAKLYYGIQDDELSEYDMKWQPEFDTRQLDCRFLLIKNCCFLISLSDGNNNIVGQRADLPAAAQESYLGHQYISYFRACLKEFKFDDHTISEASALLHPGLVGIQLRNTDGGFVKNTGADMEAQLNDLIQKNERIYFSNDNPVDLERVVRQYSNVVAYRNHIKFQNSEVGSYASLVDLYALSQCTEIYAASRSSFSLLAHLYSDDNLLHYWN